MGLDNMDALLLVLKHNSRLKFVFSDINVYVSVSNKDRKKLRDNMSSCRAKSNKDVGGEDRKT